MFDRILLLLLILLLPLGILASRWTTGELKTGAGLAPEQVQKIEALMDKLNQNAAQPAAVLEEIQITAIIFASESAQLKVSGVAPKTQAFLWVWTASSKSNKDTGVVWTGPLVVWPGAGGTFTASLDVSNMAGIVEIRMEQDKALTNVRYDLDNKKELQ